MISCWGSFHSFSSFLHTSAQSLVSILVSDAYKLTMYGYIIYFVRLVGCSLRLVLNAFRHPWLQLDFCFRQVKRFYWKRGTTSCTKVKIKIKKVEIDFSLILNAIHSYDVLSTIQCQVNFIVLIDCLLSFSFLLSTNMKELQLWKATK